MKSTKISRRLRRGKKTKVVQSVYSSRRFRLVVSKSCQHIYSQIVDREGIVWASSSTIDKALRDDLKGPLVERAKQVGALLGKRAKEKDIHQVAFDRNGFKYHGRIKALADAAREVGLDF